MAQVILEIPDEIVTGVPLAYGGTIEEHLLAALEKDFKRWEAGMTQDAVRNRMEKYLRLDKAKQVEVDAILAEAKEKEKL